MKVDAPPPPPPTGTNHANIITISETLLAFLLNQMTVDFYCYTKYRVGYMYIYNLHHSHVDLHILHVYNIM